MIVRRAFLVLLVICLGCSAQSPPSSSSGPVSAVPSDITKVVERHVRAQYSLPPDVQVKVGTPRSSEFPNYDALTVTFASPGQKKDFEFLLSHDHKTLLRVTRLDVYKRQDLCKARGSERQGMRSAVYEHAHHRRPSAGRGGSVGTAADTRLPGVRFRPARDFELGNRTEVFFRSHIWKCAAARATQCIYHDGGPHGHRVSGFGAAICSHHFPPAD